ncbi:MAG TPA: RHS repeat-associated core domain-containing protein, partial [Ohtaekwangia sp.]
PAIALRVNPGDEIEAESYAFYYRRTGEFNRAGFTMGILSSVLGGSFVGKPGLEGSTLAQATDVLANALAAGGFMTDNDPTLPYAYINYIVFDENMVSIASDYRRVTGESFEDPVYKHERVAFDEPIVIGPGGKYIYVWVSCESPNTQIWFDDVMVKHTSPAMVVQATDYGVWGDVLREQKTDESNYRFGYQGQFAERDEETGWNHFELREYDPVIGRWLVPDPYGEFWSPYLAFANNPINRVDPTGGLTDPKPGELNAAGTHTWGLNASTGKYEWAPVMQAVEVIPNKRDIFIQDLTDVLSSIFSANPKFGVRFWGSGDFGGGGQVIGGRDWHPGMEVIDVNINDMNQVMSLLERKDLKRTVINNKTLTASNPNIQDKVEKVVIAILDTKQVGDILYEVIKQHADDHTGYVRQVEDSLGNWSQDTTFNSLTKKWAREHQRDDSISWEERKH